MNEKQLAALIRKNVGLAEQRARRKQNKTYDATLDATRPTGAEDDNSDAQEMFKEMKRREF
jgi:hypothetical protein